MRNLAYYVQHITLLAFYATFYLLKGLFGSVCTRYFDGSLSWPASFCSILVVWHLLPSSFCIKASLKSCLDLHDHWGYWLSREPQMSRSQGSTYCWRWWCLIWIAPVCLIDMLLGRVFQPNSLFLSVLSFSLCRASWLAVWLSCLVLVHELLYSLWDFVYWRLGQCYLEIHWYSGRFKLWAVLSGSICPSLFLSIRAQPFYDKLSLFYFWGSRLKWVLNFSRF